MYNIYISTFSYPRPKFPATNGHLPWLDPRGEAWTSGAPPPQWLEYDLGKATVRRFWAARKARIGRGWFEGIEGNYRGT